MCPLAEQRALVPALAQLLTATWPDHYGSAGPGSAIDDATARAQSRGLPRALVAVDSSNRVIGSGTLDRTSFGAEIGEAPWITGLCVDPTWRNRGVATRLVAGLCEMARADGYRVVYATTYAAVGLLQRSGFMQYRTATETDGPLQVMCLRFDGQRLSESEALT